MGVVNLRDKQTRLFGLVASEVPQGAVASAFARRHRLGVERLKGRQGQLGTPAAKREGSGARLVPVVIKSPVSLVALEFGAMEFAVSLLVGTVRIEVSGALGTDPRWVAALVRELCGGRP